MRNKASTKDAAAALAKAKKRARALDLTLQAAGVQHKRLHVSKALLEDVQQQLLELAAQITDAEIDPEALLSAFLGVVQHTEVPAEGEPEAETEMPVEGEELPSLEELEQMIQDEDEEDEDEEQKAVSVVALKQTQLLDRMLRRLDSSDKASDKLAGVAGDLLEQNAKLLRAVHALTERVEAVETKQRMRPRASAAASTQISAQDARARSAVVSDDAEFWKG